MTHSCALLSTTAVCAQQQAMPAVTGDAVAWILPTWEGVLHSVKTAAKACGTAVAGPALPAALQRPVLAALDTYRALLTASSASPVCTVCATSAPREPCLKCDLRRAGDPTA